MKNSRSYGETRELQKLRVGRSYTAKEDSAHKKTESDEQVSQEGDDIKITTFPTFQGNFPSKHLLTLGLTESKDALLEQIHAINRQLGRDVTACLRPLPTKKDNFSFPGRPKRLANGFKLIAKASPRSRQTYLKSARSDERFTTDSGSRRVLSPSQQSVFELKETLKLTKTSYSQRQLMKTTFDTQINAVREKILGKLDREMESLNRNGIFSRGINEVRATSSMNVRVESHMRFSAREFMLKEKEKLLEEQKNRPAVKKEARLISEEEQKKLDAEKRKLLLEHLEDKLVDKIARAERKAKVSDDLGIVRLTSEQIEAKLAKMKTESLKRQKPVMVIRGLPVLDIAQGSRRLPHAAAF